MNEQKTYTIVSDDLCSIVGGDGAVICGKVVAFCGDNETCTISKEYLLGLLPLSERTLDRLLAKLQMLGYITYKAGGGRGRLCTFGKGVNIAPFIVAKKVQICHEKGVKIAPIKYNKNIDSLTRTHVRENKQTKRKGNAGKTPAPPKEAMEQFEQFWQAFFFGSYAQYEQTQESYRQRAASVWWHMSESARAACLRDIRAGRRYDRTEYILYYLQKYKEPLPIYVNGDSELTPQFVEHACVLRYKGNIAYCAPEHLDRCKAAGATLIRDNNKKE